MASVSILYLDWNFIYFITKACLKFVLASSQLGRGGERGGGTRAPGSQVLQPLTLTPGSRPPPTGGLEGGGTMLSNGVTLVTGHYKGMQSNSL